MISHTKYNFGYTYFNNKVESVNIIKEYKLNVKDDYLCVSHSLFCTARKVTSKIFAAVSEAAPGGILPEQVFLEISQNSQENACGKVFF